MPNSNTGVSAVLSARRVYWRLVSLEVRASCAAVIVMFILALFGLDFTTSQWVLVMVAMPFCVAAYMIPDLYLLTRHFRPIGQAALSPPSTKGTGRRGRRRRPRWRAR